MRFRRITAAVAGLVGAALMTAAGWVAAREVTMKEMMGENFGGMQTILVSLITSNYQSVPPAADVIYQHAVELTRMVPATAKGQEDRFLSYAYNLQGNSKSLKEVVELLIQRDKERSAQGALVTDSLREVVAAHYGGIVNMCVACHNRFRPKPPQ